MQSDSFFIPSSHRGSGSPHVRETDINSDLSSLQSKDPPGLQQKHPGTHLQVLVTVLLAGFKLIQTASIYRHKRPK